MRAPVFVIVAPLLLLDVENAAAVMCGGVPSASYNICSRCVTKMERSTTKDRPCSVAFAAPQGRVLLRTRLASPAKNGKVTMTQTGYTYAPRKGFVGTDTFTAEIVYLDGDKALVTVGHVTMTVQP